MPIDWEAIRQAVREAVADAVEETDDELAGRVSSLTRLTAAEVQELFPTPVDVERLQKLMAIVAGATRDNEQVVKLEENIHELAGTVVKLLAKFMTV